MPTAVCDKIREKLKALGQDVWSLEDVEKWDPYVRDFNLKTASATEWFETVQANLEKGDAPVTKDAVIWELQRFAAICEKLRAGRQERVKRLEEREKENLEEIEASRAKLQKGEEKSLEYEKQVARCEMLRARKEAASRVGPASGMVGAENPSPTPLGHVAPAAPAPPAAPAAATNTVVQPWATDTLAGQPPAPRPVGGVVAAPFAGAQPRPPPAVVQSSSVRPPPPPVPSGAPRPAGAALQATGVVAAAAPGPVPPGGEGSDVDSSDNPWDGL